MVNFSSLPSPGPIAVPWRPALAAAAVLLLLLAMLACGGGSQPQTAAPTAAPAATEAAPAAAAPGEVVTLQVVCINRTLRPCELIRDFYIPRVDERTGGQVKIEISSYPELGLAGPDTIRLVNDQTLEFAEIYSGYVGGDLPVIDVGNLWGVSPSNEAHLALSDAIEDDMIRILRDATGGEPVFRAYYPNQYIFSRDPLPNLAAYSGKDIRQHSAVLGDLLSGLGAAGQFVAFADVYTALERGVLDAGITGGTPGYGQRWYEVTDYLYGPIVGSVAVTYITVNGEKWDELTPEHQRILKEVGAEFDAENRRLLKAEWDPDGINLNVAEGMEYSDFPNDVKTQMRAAALDIIIPNWVKRAGGPNSEGVNIFNEKVGPIVGVVINPDGTASETEAMMMAPSADCAGRAVGEVCITIAPGPDGAMEAMAATQCDGPTAPSVPDTPGGGSPSGWSCGQESGINFNLTPLESEGLNFEMQMACINRTLVDCGLAIGNYAETEDIGFVERVKRRTNGQVNFEVSSFPELGVAGPDTLRLVEDGTLDSAQIYSGYVGGDFPIMDMSNLWGLYPTQADQLAVIDAIQPKMAAVTAEQGGVQVAYMMTAHNYIFAKPQVDSLETLQGKKLRSHSTVLSDLISGMGRRPPVHRLRRRLYRPGTRRHRRRHLLRLLRTRPPLVRSRRLPRRTHHLRRTQLVHYQPVPLGRNAPGPPKHHYGGRCPPRLPQPPAPLRTLRPHRRSPKRGGGYATGGIHRRNESRPALLRHRKRRPRLGRPRRRPRLRSGNDLQRSRRPHRQSANQQRRHRLRHRITRPAPARRQQGGGFA